MKLLRSVALASILVLASCGSSEKSEEGPDVAVEGEEDGGATVVPTPAAGYFELQPGLWERTVKAAVGTVPQPERICLDAGTRALINPTNEARGIASGCKPIEQTGATVVGVVATLQCAQPKTDLGIAMRLDDGEVKTDINGLDDGMNGFSGNSVTRRIGDCPAGMKPGDIADQSGKVVGSLAQ